MKYALWIAQVLLAAAFLMAGVMKTGAPIEQLAQNMPWAAEMPGLTRFIGVSEALGGLGVLLPSITRIKPNLTPIAAAGLALVMLLAIGFHILRAEYMIVPNVVLMSMALFVAYGRTKLLPIQPRTESGPVVA